MFIATKLFKSSFAKIALALNSFRIVKILSFLKNHVNIISIYDSLGAINISGVISFLYAKRAASQLGNSSFILSLSFIVRNTFCLRCPRFLRCKCEDNHSCYIRKHLINCIIDSKRCEEWNQWY